MALIVILTAMAAGAQQAQAGLRFCNVSSFSVEIAVGYVDREQGWVSEGWWVIDAHDCKVPPPLHNALDNRFYYYYARGREGDHRKTTFTGATPFCVKHEPFKLYQAQYGKDHIADCAKAGLFSVPFSKIDTNNQPGFTLRLNGDDDINAVAQQPPPVIAPQPYPPAPPQVIQPPAVQQNGPVPMPAPQGGGGGTACQRFPNLC